MDELPLAGYNRTSCSQIMSEDPIQMKKLINQKVEIKYNSKTIFGTVYTVDPVSQMIALLIKNENSANLDLHMILRHRCESINVIGPSDFTIDHDLFNRQDERLNANEKKDRRQKVMNWLKTNMIPVVEHKDVLKVKDVLTIHPPYNNNSCLSKNEIILEKVQNLILAMPKGP